MKSCYTGAFEVYSVGVYTYLEARSRGSNDIQVVVENKIKAQYGNIKLKLTIGIV